MTNYLEPPINFAEAEAIGRAIEKPEIPLLQQTPRDLYIPSEPYLTEVAINRDALNGTLEVFPTDTPEETVATLMSDVMAGLYYQLVKDGYNELATAAALFLADRVTRSQLPLFRRSLALRTSLSLPSIF